MKKPTTLRRTAAVLGALLLMAAVLLGCDDDEVAGTGSGFQARRIDASIWASTDNSQPNTLLNVTDGAWHNLVGVNMVTTDAGGQAELMGPNCSSLYVYQNSGLTLSGCPQGGGSGTCSTGAILIRDCSVTVSTMPADVTTSGTWVSVTYLGSAQLTLVIAAEGRATITPVIALDFRPLGRREQGPDILEQFQFEVATRDLGAEVEVELPSGDDPLFYYTASDQRLSELGAIAALPPARTWLGLEELPPLNRMLRATDPAWVGWLGQIAGQAGQDGIPLGPLTPTLVTIVDGEPQPNLALSWEANEDGTNWVFDLDPDRERADGTPYTAGFVAEVLGLPENGPQLVAGFAGVEVIDDFTILVFLEAPNPEFLVQIAGIVFP